MTDEAFSLVIQLLAKIPTAIDHLAASVDHVSWAVGAVALVILAKRR